MGGEQPRKVKSEKMATFLQTEKAGHFDWLIDFADLDPLLAECLGKKPPENGDARISSHGDVCVVGCGTSTLSEEIASAPWFDDADGPRRVISNDYDSGCIDHMQARTDAQTSDASRRLEWVTADLSVVAVDNEASRGMLQAGAFGGVVDKGTLDAMLCEGLGADVTGEGSSASASSALMCNASRLLAPGGVYIIVSLHPPAMLVRLLEAEGLGFESRLAVAKVVRSGEGGNPSDVSSDLLSDLGCKQTPAGYHSVVVAVRSSMQWENLCSDIGGTAGSLRSHVEAAHTRALDVWFTEVDALLTPERIVELSQSWELRSTAVHGADKSRSSGGTGARLSLRIAHMVVFSEDERSEYAFEDFVEDLAMFREETRAKTPSGVVVRSEIGLEEVISFLKSNQ